MALATGTHVEWGHFDAAGKFWIDGHGRVGTLKKGAVPDDAAVYRCVGRLKAGATRSNENVEAVEVLVIDDVGTRISQEAMELLAPDPTFIIETSPGNHQWQYVISGGMPVADYVALRASMRSHPVWGKSHATAPSNLVRLPWGVNGKPGHETFLVGEVGGSGVERTAAVTIAAFGGIHPGIVTAIGGGADRAPSAACLSAVLGRLPNDGASAYCGSYDAWIEFGLALWGASGGTALAEWEAWCAVQPQPGADPAEKWKSFSGTKIGWGFLSMLEDLHGQGSRAPLAGALFDDGVLEAEPLARSDTVEALQRDVANMIAESHGHRVKYNVTTSLWHVFSGTWQESPHPLGYRLAKRWADAAAPTLGKAARAAVSKSAFYAGVEAILKADERVAVVKGDFDRDDWLLGTPRGTVDLRTGRLGTALAEDMISLSTSVVPAEGEDCPRWLRFVDWACTDPATGVLDLGLRRMLRQWAGYCLTGDVSKEAVMFFHGSGANGKGTFIETMQWVLGSYFYMATKDLFMEGKFSVHTEEIAALAGKRMVAADEVPTNARWNESLLKAVSGGGVMTTRHLYGRVFTFPIRFKVTIIGNEKPAFQGEINEALRRRMHLAGFLNVAKPVDDTLKATLRLEGAGVLRWAINGLLDLLGSPGGKLFVADSVIAATEEYFAEHDLFGAWLAENVEPSPGTDAPAGRIFEDWRQWRGARGAPRIIDEPRKFKDEMVRRGYVWAKLKSSNVYKDITVISSPF